MDERKDNSKTPSATAQSVSKADAQDGAQGKTGPTPTVQGQGTEREQGMHGGNAEGRTSGQQGNDRAGQIGEQKINHGERTQNNKEVRTGSGMTNDASKGEGAGDEDQEQENEEGGGDAARTQGADAQGRGGISRTKQSGSQGPDQGKAKGGTPGVQH